MFGKAKEAWFTEQLNLEHGIPSQDTLGDVFEAIDTEAFSECFSNWITDLAILAEEDIIAIDGKCLRRSIDKSSNKSAVYIQEEKQFHFLIKRHYYLVAHRIYHVGKCYRYSNLRPITVPPYVLG